MAMIIPFSATAAESLIHMRSIRQIFFFRSFVFAGMGSRSGFWKCSPSFYGWSGSRLEFGNQRGHTNQRLGSSREKAHLAARLQGVDALANLLPGHECGEKSFDLFLANSDCRFHVFAQQRRERLGKGDSQAPVDRLLRPAIE